MPDKEVIHLHFLLFLYRLISPATSTLRLLSHVTFPLDILVLTSLVESVLILTS